MVMFQQEVRVIRADVLVDLQFGSTGKGSVATYLVGKHKYDSSVRVQSIQAGHTIYHKGKAYKMRTIPCAWVDPDVELIIGAGCFIERELLLEEIEMVSEATGRDVRDRLFVDSRVFFVEEGDVQEERDRALERGMGSTAHGAGASLVRKMWRDPLKGGRVSDSPWAEDEGITVCDTIERLQGQDVLVEGCQGALLSIHTSPYWPYVTTRESTAAGIMAEAGIAPRDVRSVLGVYRTLPIRVGGNSGPTGAPEISWEEVNRRAGYVVEPERTTVTKRVRRVFEFSDEDFARACWVNKPDWLFMNFANYIAPGVYGKSSFDDVPAESAMAIQCEVERAERLACGGKVRWIGTGEMPEHFIEL
jgi:adenylosuccinate synthase